jgi:hypothetical protein
MITPPLRSGGNIRLATGKEEQAWRKVLALSEKVWGRMWAAQMLNANAAMSYKWGVEHNQPVNSPAPLEEQLLELEVTYKKLRDAIQRVEDREYGLVFGPEGEIAIAQPRPDDLGGWIIPVVVGGAIAAIVIANVVDSMMDHFTRQGELIAELNRYKTMNEALFCKEGNEETCELWEEFKTSSGYTQREEESEGILDKIGRGIATGAKWGIGAGVVILVAVLAMSFRRK